MFSFSKVIENFSELSKKLGIIIVITPALVTHPGDLRQSGS